MIKAERIEELENTLDELEKHKVLESWKYRIKEIEKKYFPNRDDFDLPTKIFGIYRIYRLFELSEDEKLIIEEKLDKLIKLYTALALELATTPDRIKELSQTGTSAVVEIMDSSEFNNDNWTFDSHKNDIIMMLYTFKFIKERIKKTKSNSSKAKHRKWIIVHLVSIFCKGKQKPIDLPKKNGSKNIYTGEVVDFVLAIQPFLKQLGIQEGNWGASLGTPASIGKTIRTFLIDINKNEIIKSIP